MHRSVVLSLWRHKVCRRSAQGLHKVYTRSKIAMRCDAIRCYATWCETTRCDAMRCDFDAMRCDAMAMRLRCDAIRLGCDCDAIRLGCDAMQCGGSISKLTLYRQSPDPTSLVC